MTKIVIHKGYGGFNLSYKLIMRYAKLAMFNVYAYKCDYKSDYKNCEYIKLTEDEINYIDQDEIYYLYNNENVVTSEDSDDLYLQSIDRSDCRLIMALEEMPDEMEKCELKIVEIPDAVDWYIEEDDSGYEWIAERHRTWS